MKKKPNDVIRVGDRVSVTDDKFIIRVGYPIIWKDLFWEVAESEELQNASKILGVNLDEYRIIKEIAHLRARKERFGGNERQIIYYPGPDQVQEHCSKDGSTYTCLLAHNPPREEDYLEESPYRIVSKFLSGKAIGESCVGKDFYVIKKRIAKTGKRFAPSHYGYGEDAEYEPGGLEDEKTHVILELSNGFEIEQIHVKKVI